MSGLDDGLLAGLMERGVSRRAFLKFCAAMTAVLALPAAYAPRVAAAVAAAPRMPVIWLRGQGCGGETEALLRAANPSTSALILDLLSIDYADAFMAASGKDAEAARAATIRAYPGGYFAVIEGAVPAAEDGAYLTIGGRAFSEIVREVSAGAAATIAIGSCAFDGGLAAASGGVTGADGVASLVPGTTLVSLPGCPINVENLTATIVHYLTFKELPARDIRRRPLFAYGALIHNQCERRPHFEFGEFVQAWGDEGAQKGWCLYKMGCKGPESYANCPTARYGEGTSWPVKAGAGCIGCTMPGFWDTMSPFSRRLPSPVPFAPNLTADQVGLAAVVGVGGLAAVHGAASIARARLGRRHAVAAVVAEAPAAVSAEAPAAAAPIAVPAPVVAAPPETVIAGDAPPSVKPETPLDSAPGRPVDFEPAGAIGSPAGAPAPLHVLPEPAIEGQAPAELDAAAVEPGTTRSVDVATRPDDASPDDGPLPAGEPSPTEPAATDLPEARP